MLAVTEKIWLCLFAGLKHFLNVGIVVIDNASDFSIWKCAIDA